MYSDLELQIEIANNFMNNKVSNAIKYCYNIIKNRNGNAPDEYYLMLFDMLKVQNQQDLYEKAAIQYYRIKGKTAPDWENREFNRMVEKQNVLVINFPLNEKTGKQINEFANDCEKNKFGRLDLNYIDILHSNEKGLKILLTALYRLKNIKKAEIILIGQQNILNFPIDSLLQLKKQQEENNVVEENDSSLGLALLAEAREIQNQRYAEEFRNKKEKWETKNRELKTKLHQLLSPNEDELRGRNNSMNGLVMGKVNQNQNQKKNSKEEQLKIEALKQEIEEHEKLRPEDRLEVVEESFIERRIENMSFEKKENNHEISATDYDKMIELLFLLKMEILQWDGQEENYEILAKMYRDKYKKFAPDYNVEFETKNRVKPKERIGVFEFENGIIKSITPEINHSNLDMLEQLLVDTNNFNSNKIIIIDLQNTNFFTYNAAMKLMVFLKENKDNIKVVIKNSNSLMKVIFKITGLDLYATIV